MQTETLAAEAATQEIQYPYLSDRIQSTFIDTFFILILMVVFSQVLEYIENPPDWLRASLFISIWLLYDPLCTAYGCTLGNYFKNIRVRCRDDHFSRINIFQAFCRYLFKIAFGWISFLFIHSNYEKRALHDLVAGSIVVRKA